ncbi:MAG: 6-pyruvoyl-tetrahydropterin synthase-related protein [Chloroflexota bacterium]|nr:6-pyruvoyl-tetrahydropterin synthase-related protein [Chloroflexota bacterium]
MSLIAAAVMGVFAALPLLDGRLPEAHDILFHLYRLVQVDQLMQRGVLFSRWAPEMAYGYGYPLFNFYAPVAYYLAEIPVLLGTSYPTAVLLTFAAALIGAAVSMYLWVRELWGGGTALVAAAAYALSPYLMITTMLRGSLAEQVALAWLPLLLWAFLRFARTDKGLYAMTGVTVYVTLILSHNITALLFTPLLFLYTFVLAFTYYHNWRERGGLLGQLWLMMGLGLGITSFFWWPALAERDLVKIYQLYMPGVFDYTSNFMPLAEIFAWPATIDPRLMTQSPPVSLSVVALVLACMGLGSVLLRKHIANFEHVVFVALGALVTIFMVLPSSKFLWRSLPLMHFLQFPWRFLGVASLLLALLSGMGYQVLTVIFAGRGKLLRLLAPMLILSSLFYLIPWQYIRRYPVMNAVTMLDAARFERHSGSIGTTTAGEYLPGTVQENPAENSPALTNGGQRLDETSLPAGARVLAANYDPTRYQLTLEAPSAFTAVFNTFDFPGWQATVNSELVAITPTEPYGLISIPVPAGETLVEIRFGSTPVRTWATGISLGSVGLLVGWMFLRARHQAKRPPIPVCLADMPTGMALSVMLVMLSVAIFKLVYIDAEGRQTFFRRTRFDGQTVAGLEHQITVNFEHQLHLLGLDAPTIAASGDTVPVSLYWRVPASTEREYSVGVSLVDERGIRFGQSDNQHPGGFPTRRWDPAGYACDPHAIQIPAGTPPGEYWLEAAVYPYGQPEQGLSVLDANEAPAGRAAKLIPLTVTRPSHAPAVEALAPQHSTRAPLGTGLLLLGYDLPATSLQPGERLPLTLYWEAQAPCVTDLQVRVQLRDAAGELFPLGEMPLVAGYPTSRWEPGDLWRGVQRPLLPPALLSGEYMVEVLAPGVTRAVELDGITIVAPVHQWRVPEVESVTPASFGELISLVGYTGPQTTTVQAGESLSLTLVWRVQQGTTEQYKTFVHLLNAEGQLVSGSDQVPVGWQRPSTGWVADEYLQDAHSVMVPVALPAGTYQLQGGLYNAVTLERLTTTTGEDAVLFSSPVEIIP